ncbi:hypothetical protein [Mycolicibacterium fluoranthenivorans]|uniref:Uncharacterized protein n=1 Tax=Mycolicibacterium fluoranthenivorans TaxID=258505 RepID=A0A7X5U1T6_9MYCO|nr:hypothetical protein [Mycolicibacterium fluoranthenivorans]NIH96782.1 hypothetical protein [Mycolicibacterium fluoranthenivorans]
MLDSVIASVIRARQIAEVIVCEPFLLPGGGIGSAPALEVAP